MKESVFVNLNIFIYLMDRSDSIRTSRAVEFFKSIEKSQVFMFTQAVKGFYQVDIRKIKMTKEELLKILMGSNRIKIGYILKPLLDKAISIQLKYQFSSEDRFIVAPSRAFKCNMLYSEYMDYLQEINDILIINPFKN